MVVMVFFVMLTMTVCLAACGNAAPADPYGGYAPDVPAGADGSGEAASKENESPGRGIGEQDADSRSTEAEQVSTPGAGEVIDDGDESVEGARDTDGVQGQESMESGEKADAGSGAQGVAEKDAVEALPVEDTRTEDEKLADKVLAAGSTKATAETDLDACVVDVRTANNTYDIVWDYGIEFRSMVMIYDDVWDYVFDAEYYKDAFPMLALQYNQEDDWLKLHFVTVGIHEGRQGSEHFNVKAYMDTCPDWIREKFGDNYACYYLYWLLSDEVDRSVPVVGNDCPKQMAVVLTAVQQGEFDKINALRESLDVEPLVADPEMLALANYRAWINAYENWADHDWAKQNLQDVWDMVALIDGKGYSENTTSRFYMRYDDWFRGYKCSKPHYEAMVDEAYGFVGCSNVYACANTLERYVGYTSETRLCHFDVFMETLDTAMNPR